ncbi:MAG: cellulase family glycosylhydrolase, partial [Verrucomicrobiota bacterium]|nr:cellulase family glycosylhydrolase [Verrucomicrobiota bacterium]
MKGLWLGLAAALPLAGLCGEARLGMGGKLTVGASDAPVLELGGGLFTEGWKKSAQGGGTGFPDKQGVCAFTLKASEREQVAGSAAVTQTADGALHAVYTFTPKADMALNGLFVGGRLAAGAWAGAGTWRADGAHGEFPPALGKQSLFSGKIRTLELGAKNGETWRVAFDEPTQVLIQDDRTWSESFTLRLGNNGLRSYAKGVPLRVAFTLTSDTPPAFAYQQPIILRAGGEWATLEYEKEIVPGSALDFSHMGFTDAPAGKYGWLKADGPHFVFERKPGVPQRFYGVNLCNTANFPAPEQAGPLADRLVRLGYNSVRIHHYDNGCVQGSPDGLTLNPEQMARLDAFLAACYARGLYVTTDLYVSRNVTWRQIGIARDDPLDKQVFKALIAVHEPAFQNWAAFARAFLTHVNPHTGRRYADEPGMPFIALINEGSIGYRSAEARETPAMQAAWAAWLGEKRAQEPAAFAGLPDALPAGMNGREGAAAAQFIADIEAKMVSRMKAFLRDELGCRALLSNYNCGTHYTAVQPVRAALYDYVDDHFYVDHPQFIDKRWALPSRCANENPLLNGCRAPCNTAFTRLPGKPFTVSEYNFSGPGMYRGVGGIMTGAMGALQDWSALWRFSYSHRLENMLEGQGAVTYFDVSTDPLSQASERASLCLFLRRDLEPARHTVAIGLDAAFLSSRAVAVAPGWATAAWNVQVGTAAGPSSGAPAGAARIPAADAYGTNAVTALAAWTNTPSALVIDRARGAFTVATERTVGGFAESGRIAAGPLTAEIRGAPATVWVSALDGASVPASGRLLLTHLTDVQNTGVTYADAERKILLAWGQTPYLVRTGTADVALTLD